MISTIVLIAVGVLLFTSQWILVKTVNDWKDAGVDTGYAEKITVCPYCGKAISP